MKKSLILFAIIILIVGCLTLSACVEGASPVTGIVVTDLPVTTYYRGDRFNFNDAKITVYYENGKTESLSLEPSMISDFDSQTLGKQILTVKYEGATTHIEVTVENPPVYSISIADGYKYTYVEGQGLNLNDSFIVVQYSNGFSERIQITSDMVSGFDTSRTGLSQFLVSYLDKTAVCEVEVVAKSIATIGIEAPDRRNYVVGDKVDFYGARLFVSYNNNTSEYLEISEELFNDDFYTEIGNERTSALNRVGGAVAVTVHYYGLNTSFYVSVEEVRGVELILDKDIAPQPKNSAGINIEGKTVTVIYNNNKQQTFELTLEHIDLRDFDITRNGTYDIDITYDGLTITVPVTVVNPEPKELIVILPQKNYYVEGAGIDFTEWQYRVRLTNGEYRIFDDNTSIGQVTETMLAKNDYDFGTETAGVREYEVVYSEGNKNLSAKVEIEVYEKVPSEILFNAPQRNVYQVGEGLDISDGSITVKYNDGSEKTVDLTVDLLEKNVAEYTAINGKQTVTVIYTDEKSVVPVSFDFEITVLKSVANLNAGLDEVKKEYVLGESFDRSGLIVYVLFSDSTSDSMTDFSGEIWSFEGESFDKIGDTFVRVYYGHKSHGVYADIPVKVTNDVVDIRFAEGFTSFGEVTEGLSIVISDSAKMVVTRQNGDVETVNILSSMLDYDKTDYTLGERKITVTYEKGVTLETSVGVVSRKITFVTVERAPTKQDYVTGETEYSLSGMVLRVLYDNGMELQIAGERLVFVELADGKAVYATPNGMRQGIVYLPVLNTEIPEDKISVTLSVSAEVKDVVSETTGQANFFELYCFKDIVRNIKINLGNSQLEVFEREDIVFPAEATVTVTYETREPDVVSVSEITEDYFLSDFDKFGAGYHSVTFNYLRKQCSFMVSVKGKVLCDMSVNPVEVRVKEGLPISADAVTVTLHYLRNDGAEYEPSYRPNISFDNVNCTYDPSDVEFDANNECVQTHTVSYTYDGVTLEREITVIVSRKRAVAITMQQYPKDVYVENESRFDPSSDDYVVVGDTALSLAGGYVMVTYDNGTGERISLESNRLTVNSAEFDPSEISDGSSRQARIYARFEDETGHTVEVAFYVTIKDRHYLSVDYGTSSASIVYTYVYGTQKSARPQFTVTGRRVFGGNEVELTNDLIFDEQNDSRFDLYYTLNGARIDGDWPKEVGSYKMVIEFFGDAVNNYWKDESVTIRITPKDLAVQAIDKTLRFGDVYDEEIEFFWTVKNADAFDTSAPLEWEDEQEDVAKIGFIIRNRLGAQVDFTKVGNVTVVNLAARNDYSIEPVLLEMLSDNYRISEDSLKSATLQIQKMDISVVALSHEKTYGETDERFRFEIYSLEGALIGGYYPDNELFVTLYSDGENTVTDGIQMYTILREQGENVGEYAMLAGVDSAIPNYNIYDENGNARFTSATLTINRKSLYIEARQAETPRKYGEKFLENWQNEYLFSTNDEMAYRQYFNAVFADLINYKDGYYNADGTKSGRLNIEVFDEDGKKVCDFAPDVSANVGKYYIEISVNYDLSDKSQVIGNNYSVTIERFEFVINPMTVTVEAKTEFTEYTGIDRGVAIADGKMQVEVEYTLTFGDNFDEENANLPTVTFAKNAGSDVGKYEIVLTDETITNNVNYVFNLIGDYGTAFDGYFAEKAGIKNGLPKVADEEYEKPYLVILPSEIKFSYGTSEVYSKRSTEERFFPTVEIDYGEKTVPVDEAELLKAFFFELTNKNIERMGAYYNVDEYSGVVRYDYFLSTLSKNFIVTASNNENKLSATAPTTSNYTHIYAYVLFEKSAETEIIFTERFDYSITPKEISVEVVNGNFDYTGEIYKGENANNKGIVVSYPQEELCAGDSLYLAYDVKVKYYNRDAVVKGEFIREAGDYSVEIVDLGNFNYTRTEETANTVCEFTVFPIILDIAITKAVDDGDRQVVYGSYTGRADTRLMSNVWREGDGANEGYFITDSHAVVNETSLTTAPNNLIVEPYYIDIDGTIKFPVNAGTYKFRAYLNASYDNLEVRFVKKTENGYTAENCEYFYEIRQKEVTVLGFENVSSKLYDGEEPKIKDTTRLTLFGDVSFDRVSASDLIFTFEREMSKVPENLREVITAEDMTSVGYFNVYITSKKTKNYKFILNGSLDNPVYYTIQRPTVQIILNRTASGVTYALTKQYDALSPTVTQEELRINYQGTITDEIFVDLQVISYKAQMDGTFEEVSAVSGNPVGFYGYKFRPYIKTSNGKVYCDEAEGQNVSSKMLSWNYCYTAVCDFANKGNADGVYVIDPKDVYISLEGATYANGKYVYYRPYNQSEVSLSTAQADINAKYVIADTDGKVISDDLNFARRNLTLYGGLTSATAGNIVDAGDYFEVNSTELILYNGNFNILNSDLRYEIAKLKVQLTLKFTDAEGNSSSVYGDSDGNATVGAKFTKTFGFYDEEAFVSAMTGEDAGNGIDYWIGRNEGDYNRNKFYINPNGNISYYCFIDEDGSEVDGNGRAYNINRMQTMNAGTYYAYISSITAKNFEFEIIGGEFIIQKKAIVILNAERDYFDKNSLQINHTVTGGAVDEAFEKSIIRAITARFTDGTGVADNAGSYATDNTCYISAAKVTVNELIAEYNNYTVQVGDESVRPNGYNSSRYYIALTIKKRDLFVSVNPVTLTYAKVLKDNEFSLVYDTFPELRSSDGNYDYYTEIIKQESVRNDIRNCVDWESLSAYLASLNASEGQRTEALTDYLKRDADLGLFENYNVEFGTFAYNINKITLRFGIVNNADRDYNTDGLISIIAGEANALRYSETERGRLNYHIELSASERAKIIGYDQNEHTSLQSVLNLTWSDNANEGLSTDYASFVRYTILKNGSTSLTAGKCDMTVSFGMFSSRNYVYVSDTATVMYYPRIRSIGSQGGSNEIPFSGVSLLGNENDYLNNITENLSMIVQISYEGMPDELIDSFIDLRSGVDTSLYDGLRNHSAAFTVVFADGKPTSVAVGDEIKLKLQFEEVFFSGSERITYKIESEEFIVRLYKTADELILNKNGMTFDYYNGQSSFEEVKKDNATYYLYDKDSDGIYSGNFDQIYTEFILTPKKGAENYSYTQVLFDDGTNKLVLGFKGGKDFGYYAWIEDSETGIRKEDTVKNLAEYVFVDDNGEEHTRSILADNVSNLFDGRRHKLNVYIDKVGRLNYSDTSDMQDESTLQVIVSRYYTVAFIIDDSYAYAFEIKGGERIATIELEDSDNKTYTYNNYIDFSVKGKTGFAIKECEAFVGAYTLKTMGIKLDASGNVTDLRPWPVSDDSFIFTSTLEDAESYITAKTLNSVDGYSGKVSLDFSYTTFIGNGGIDKSKVAPGLYNATLTAVLNNATVFVTSYKVCVSPNTETMRLRSVDGVEYGIYPDKPITLSAISSEETGNEPIGNIFYSSERQQSINYSAISFDFVGGTFDNANIKPSITFYLKSAENGTLDMTKGHGISLRFERNDAGTYNASVTVGLERTNIDGVTYMTSWQKDVGTADLENSKNNVLKTRFDYNTGTIQIIIIRDGEIIFSTTIRREFVDYPTINDEDVRNVIGDPNSPYGNGGYVGFYLYGADITLHEYLVDESKQSALNLAYIEEGNLTGIGTPADEANIYGKNVILADAFGGAKAVTKNNTFFKFTALSGESFDFMFHNNTPYFFETEIAEFGLTENPSGERGSIISFTKDGIYVSIYKYKSQWVKWKVNKLNLLDGKSHTVMISFDRNKKQVIDDFEFYVFTLMIDGVAVTSPDSTRIPVSNDCSALRVSGGGTDIEASSYYDKKRDNTFAPSVRYVGIMPLDSVIRVEELFAF